MPHHIGWSRSCNFFFARGKAQGAGLPAVVPQLPLDRGANPRTLGATRMRSHLTNLEVHARTALKAANEGQITPAERIALYKRFLKIEEHRIKLRHRAGAGGLEIARARSELLDTVLRSLLETALATRRQQIPQLALVATGGYGRGTLNPGSDIDLLFLLPRASNKLPKPIEELVQDILYVLWDVGFRVGHACRSVAECLSQARADQQNHTALLDARLLAGDARLFREFEKRFERECVRKEQARYFAMRREDLLTRHKKFLNTVFLQEPNVKEGCGGLRDYHNMLWVARVKRGRGGIPKLAEDRFITRLAEREIQEAHDFLLRVRNDLHYHTRKATDTLTLQLQGVVATHFGYPQRSILRRTEAFMRDYYRHTRNLHQYCQSLMEIFEIEAVEHAQTGFRSFLTFRKRKREEFDGFVARDGMLFAASNDLFSDDPARLMRMFQHCQLRDLTISPALRKLIKSHWNLIDRQFRYSKANRETFQAILERKGDVARNLRLMHRVGFLGRYIPEFGALDCLVQHEFFHRYTADEHTLRCIEELDALVGNNEPRRATYRRLLHEIQDPYALYLAILLHDTGRAENVREHIDGSAMLAQRLCNRLQVRGPRRSLVSFLVDHHLTFWRFATTRNIEDPDVIAEFARLMRNTTRLDALLLFTYADSNGTGPDAWTGWKETLLLQLHSYARRFLTEGREKYAAGLRQEKNDLRDSVEDALNTEFAACIDEHFRHMPDAYFRFREASSVASHIRAVRQFRELETETPDKFTCSTQWIERPEMGHSEFVVVTRDRPLLLEKICCAIASRELNILSADFFTRADGIVVDLFRVCTTNFEPVTSKSTRQQVVETLHQLHQTHDYDSAVYLRRRRNFLRPRTDTGILFPVRAWLSNDLHPTCTTLELQALDRIGLLHDVFHAINAHGLTTAHARICTEKGAAVDTFYITTPEGSQVSDTSTLEALRKHLEDIIATPES